MRTTLNILRVAGTLLLGLMMMAAGCMAPAAESAPATPSSTTERTVFAAASLKDAFTECGRLFEVNRTGTRVILNFDGSQLLRTQLEKGAHADIFASANTKQMDLAQKAGLIENGSVRFFVQNRLVILIPTDNPAGIQELSDLAEPGVRLVIGTKDVPIGDYARQLLNRTMNDSEYGPTFKERVLANVISEETNVNNLATKVVLGEADAGIAYASDVPAAQKGRVIAIDLPEHYEVVADYPIGILTQTKNRDEAAAFIEFLISSTGREKLAEYGFAPV